MMSMSTRNSKNSCSTFVQTKTLSHIRNHAEYLNKAWVICTLPRLPGHTHTHTLHNDEKPLTATYTHFIYYFRGPNYTIISTTKRTIRNSLCLLLPITTITIWTWSMPSFVPMEVMVSLNKLLQEALLSLGIVFKLHNLCSCSWSNVITNIITNVLSLLFNIDYLFLFFF